MTTDRDFVLAQLRVAHLRAQLIVGEIDAIGTGLRTGTISTATALWLAEEAGLLEWFYAPGDAIERIPAQGPLDKGRAA